MIALLYNSIIFNDVPCIVCFRRLPLPLGIPRDRIYSCGNDYNHLTLFIKHFFDILYPCRWLLIFLKLMIQNMKKILIDLLTIFHQTDCVQWSLKIKENVVGSKSSHPVFRKKNSEGCLKLGDLVRLYRGISDAFDVFLSLEKHIHQL